MYIEDLDQVTALRNHRRKAMDLLMAARDGSMGDLIIYRNGEKHSVWSTISAEPIRVAIVAECTKFISDKDFELGSLGVNTSVKLVRRD